MAAPQDEAPAGSRPVAARGRSPLREGVTRGSARSRPSVCIALAILLSVALSAADHAPAQAQPPAAWLLDHFEVVHTEDVHDEVETRRYTTPGSNIDAFPFGGTKVYTGTYPTGKLIATGTLAVELPDKITPGTPFQIGGGATGQVGTPGRTGQTAATLVAYNECYVRAVCSGALKSQYLDNVEGKTVDLAAPLAAQSATLPADPQAWPPLHVVMFRGTIGTTTPGDPVWRVYVYAYYKRPETVPTPVPSFRLEVDADASRLPPSGTSPSEAVVTATMVDGAGKAIAGEVLTFALDPPDMGTIAPATGVTDAAGEVRVRYRAPKADVLGGRDSVAVVVRNAARSLERRFALRIERYRLTLKVDPADIPIEPVWRAVRVTAELRDFDGRAVVGDVLQLRVDPPDMGSFIGGTMSAGKAPTDGSGRVEAFYEPPPPSQLRGRDRATIYVSNLTHGGEEGAGVRFIGLKIIRTWPAADARDIVLESDDTVDIEFDRPIDPATVTGATVKLETLWHGDLGTRPESFGPSANLRVTADPVPDVGLRVKVTVAGGENGVKGRDGAVMAGPHTFWFRTMPKFDPKIIVSQVVDNPRDRLFGYITLSVKPFALRVDAGISEDSELEDERVAVRLLIPRRSADMTLEHTYYPGRWPPKVPDAAAKKGNTANFVVPGPIGRGGYTVQAELRPVHAVPEKVITVPPVSFNVNSWSDVGAARKIGLLAVPIVNDQIPGSAWTVSRGQQEQWLLGLAQPAANLLPLTRLDLRLSYLADTTCNDPDACRAAHPWTSFLKWAKNLGRVGFMTRIFGWRYSVALVPPGYFDRFADHPDALANPGVYHDAIQNGIWSQRMPADGGRIGESAFPISLMEVGVSPEALVHVLGDVEGLADSGADRDRLNGYDLLNDRVIHSDAERSIGASRSVMNLGVGFGSTWPATGDHEAFMDLWTERSCVGPPPCPPRFVGAASGDAGLVARRAAGTDAVAADAQVPVQVMLISGTIRRSANGGGSATFDPIITAPGTPSLDPGATGEYGLDVQDGSGNYIARYHFTPVFGPVDRGELAGFLIAVPADPTASAVTITLNDSIVERRIRSANPPTVRFTQPQPATTRRGDIEVAWTGEDADSDALTYTLLFSGDGGQRWEPLLMDSRLTRHTLPSALVGNGPEAQLRVVAMDGFDSGEANVAFGLDNPLTVLAVDPPDGAKGVAVRTLVQAKVRDPLDAASMDEATLTLFGVAGGGANTFVAGDVGYEPIDRAVVFTPTLELTAATTYEARLSRKLRTRDGRTLLGDHVWTFTTRGHTVYLPWSVRSGNVAQRTPTPRPSHTAGPSPTRAPTSTPTPSRTMAPTPDEIGTRVAATLTARVPTATATRTPTAGASPTASPTPDVIGTAVAATLTALAPTPGVVRTATPTVATPDGVWTVTPTSTSGPTPSPGAGSATVLRALTTGADAAHMRMAFAPGEAITLWVEVSNGGSGAVSATFDFAVRDDLGAVVTGLAWSGALDVAPGSSWFRLERTIPAAAQVGAHTFTGGVTVGGRTSSAESQLYIAKTLRIADDFGDPTSGWPAGQDASGSYGYVEGEYRILHTRANVWRLSWLPNGPSLTDLVVEADVRLPGTAQGWAALVFGLNAGGTDFHIFEIDRAGQYSLYRRTGGEWQTLVSPTSSDQLVVADGTNHLMLVRDSGLTTLYANGQMISLVTDLQVPAGRVGVYASNGEVGLEGRFDGFRGYAVR